MFQKKIVEISASIIDISNELNCTIIEACLEYCDKHDIEHELLGEILKKNQQLVFLLQQEAENLNFLKKEGRIPFDTI